MDLPDRHYLLEHSEFGASHIPYSVHATHDLVSTRAGDYVAVLRLEGIAFQTADIGDVNIAHESLNIILRNIASPHLTLWKHIVHEEERTYLDGEFPTSFARSLNELYKRDMGGTRLMSSSLYLSLVYRPILDTAERTILQRKSKIPSKELWEMRADAREKLSDAVRMVKRMMARYNPVQLHTYWHNGVLYSELLEFFGYLVNGYWQRMPVLPADISTYLATSRPLWGVDAYELRGPLDRRFGVMLAFQTYPGNTYSGLLNELLTQPFSYCLTQSFQFMDRTAAREALGRERDKLDGSGELVEEQIEDIEDKIRALNNGQIVFGAHHLSINVFASNEASLKAAIGLATSVLGNTGCNLAREDDALVEAFLAQLPGNFRERPRLSGLDSRNFASLASFHNHPTGQKKGNQWGDAIVMLRTTAGTPYFFNFHHSRAAVQKLIRNSAELEPDIQDHPPGGTGGQAASRREVYTQFAETEVASLDTTDVKEEFLEDMPGAFEAPSRPDRPQALPSHGAEPKKMVANLGNAIIIGPSESGKTVMQAALSTFSLKVPRMRIAVQDKDEGLKLLVLAHGGVYLSIKHGRPSGMAPLQLGENEENTKMLIRLVRKLCSPAGEVLTSNEANGISYAVRQVMRRPREERRLRKVFDLMTSDSSEGAKARLEKWVYGGENAWIFDNERDHISLDARIVGFDITEFLEDPEIRSPIIMYLAHRVRHEMITGLPFVWFWDEFWKSLDDPELMYIAKDELKTIRKKNGLLVMGTQEAEDAVGSAISSTIVQQTATMILCPNPKGDRKAYVEGLKLTETEFQIVRSGMPVGSHRYLVKQGHSSVVVELDLSPRAFANSLAILSGTKENVSLYESISAEIGSTDPDEWLPVFYERRNAP